MSVCVGAQDSGRVAAACYLCNLSTECKSTEITMEIFNFKHPLYGTFNWGLQVNQKFS